MTGELLRKYIWLIQTFIRVGDEGLTLEELFDKWEQRWDTPYVRSTFNHQRGMVEDIFGIRIECDRSTNRYFIRGGKDMVEQDSVTSWLIDTFTVNNLLHQSKDLLSGRVAVEEVPSGHEYLTHVMNAMQDNMVLRIRYQKYSSEEASRLTVYPYAVKEVARRWYLIAWCVERKGLRVYGLDRIKSMEETGEEFSMPAGFDVEELFASSYGVYLNEGKKSEKVVFKAGALEARFINDLPLHGSQEIIASDEESTTFAIRVCPNDSLIMDLLARGSRIEVLAPDSLRERMKEEINKLRNLYE